MIAKKPLTGIEKARRKRQQLGKLMQAMSYNPASVQIFLNNPRNHDMLTHEEIAMFMMQKRQHNTLAASLGAFKNLSTDTKTDLIRKGYGGHVKQNEHAFGSDAEDY
jgi:hypothetical protein